MATVNKPIKDLASLEKEISRLRKSAKSMEKELDENFAYLQQNYSSLVMNSVAGRTGYKGIPGTILHLILQHDRLREVLTKLAEQLVDKVSDGLEFVIGKFSKKGE